MPLKMDRGKKSFEGHVTKSLEETVVRNVDIKCASDEGSDGNEEHVRNWRKGDTCYKLVKNVDELYVSILWKKELVSDGLGYLAGMLSKVLKVPSFSLQLTLKCERKGIN